MNTITVQELHQLAPLPEASILVDVRTPIEYDSGHVPFAKNIPLDEIPNHADELKEYKHVYVICRSGGRSMSACMMLNELGLSNTTNVMGGTSAWAMQYPIQQQ